MNNIDNKKPLEITERACNQVKNLIEQEGNIRESLDAIHTAYICNEAEMNRVMKDIRQEIHYVLDNVNELDD